MPRKGGRPSLSPAKCRPGTFDSEADDAGQYASVCDASNRRGSWWPVVFLWITVGCAGASPRRVAFLEDLAVVEARMVQGRYDEALSAAAVLEDRAKGDLDRCPLLLARARALAGLGHHAEALGTFQRTEAACRTSPMVSARALFEVGVLVATRSPDPLEAVAVFRRVVTRFPDEPAARRAVTWIRDLLMSHRGARAAVEEMRGLYRQAGAGEVGPTLLFQAAEVLRNGENGAPARDATRDDRLALYSVILARHLDSALADDAAVEAARICMETGQPWVAVRLLVGVLARRETSWFVGSYETPIYPEAAWLMVEARLQATGDGIGAARDFVAFARDFPADRRVAEALWRAYHLFAAAGRDEEAREALRMLAEVRPRTPAGREARRRLEEGR